VPASDCERGHRRDVMTAVAAIEDEGASVIGLK
jgi:hypothetical protein